MEIAGPRTGPRASSSSNLHDGDELPQQEALQQCRALAGIYSVFWGSITDAKESHQLGSSNAAHCNEVQEVHAFRSIRLGGTRCRCCYLGLCRLLLLTDQSKSDDRGLAGVACRCEGCCSTGVRIAREKYRWLRVHLLSCRSSYKEVSWV
eukprot:2611863-Amphidinium_carterae.1